MPNLEEEEEEKIVVINQFVGIDGIVLDMIASGFLTSGTFPSFRYSS